MHPARSRLTVFSAAVIAAVAAVLAVVLPATIASAQAVPAAGNRVGASHPVMISNVGVPEPVSAGERRCEGIPQPRFASSLCVAAEENTSPTCGGMSFTASTKVVLASGAAIAISQLKRGDKVLATNTKTGKTTAETVAAVLVHHDTDKYDLCVKTGSGTAVIDTTRSHLFFDQDSKRWVKAAALRHGTRLRTPRGRNVTVLGGHNPEMTTGWMWDLTIPGDHDFYIKAATTAVLVHNCYDPGRNGNRLPNGNFTNLRPEDMPGPFKALNNNSLYRQIGTFNYVVRGDGSLAVGSRMFGHVDLALGGEVQAAGDVTIEDGQITDLTNNSGHYMPYGDLPASAAINAFETQGGFAVNPGVYREVPVP